jgi:hypothetical protein
MVEQVRKAKDFRGSLFHFGLVKILIKSTLSKKQENWDMFTIKTLASAKSKDRNVKPAPPQKKLNARKKRVKTPTKVYANPKNIPDSTIEASTGDPDSEHSFDAHGSNGVETNNETVKNTTPTEAHVEIPSSSLAAENIIDVEELAELTDKPRRNPKRKCKSTLSGMDNSVPSYPPQERLESVDDHEEAPEPSEMTWTLSQLIQKTRKVDRQATAPKGIKKNEPIQVPTGTPTRIQRDFTPELSPDHLDPVDTYERSPDEFTPELSPDHNSDPVNTPAQSPDEFTHASSPQPQPGHDKKFETYYEISSSRSLKPMVARLESRNNRLKEKPHEYTVLDRHIKTENELMKVRVTHLLSKIERLKQKNKGIFQRNMKLQKTARKHIIINRVLKKEIRNMKKQERLQMLVAAAATF